MNVTNAPGFNQDRLNHLKATVEDDIAKGKYLGGTILIARGGEIGFHEAFGDGGLEAKTPCKTDTVYSLFSTTKLWTTVLTLRAIELGQFGFATLVKDIIPEWTGGLRDKVNVYHLLTHTSGAPSVYVAKPGMYIDKLDEVIAAICANVPVLVEPGSRIDYSPLVGHALMGEMIRRTDLQGRSYCQIVEDEIFGPLGMKDSAIGRPDRLKDRHLPPDFMGNAPQDHLGSSDLGPQGAFEEPEAEMPWVGGVSTAYDMYLFGEMLRRKGEMNGHHVLSPTMCERARTNQTGDRANEVYHRQSLENDWPILPAYIGLGMLLRGEKIGENLFGSLTSPQTFGGYGYGTTILWVDPELDMTFVGLMTGAMMSPQNYLRWRRLSDIAVSAAV